MIAGGFLAAIAIGAAGFLAGRAVSPGESPQARVPPVAPNVEQAEPQQPGVLGRADILAFAARAADGKASDTPLPREIVDLPGRRFELAIPFGCDGPAEEPSEEGPGWHYDADREVLRVHVAYTLWKPGRWGAGASPSVTERAEGFWIDRPWSSSETCPARSEAAARPRVPGAERTLALATFVPVSTGDRERERRSFDAVKRVSAEELDVRAGFRLRITGRIAKTAGGETVRCIQPAGSEQRPICVIAASFGEVRVENAATGDVIAVWSVDGARQAE